MSDNNIKITPEQLLDQATHIDPTLNQEMVPKSVAIQAINLARMEKLLEKIQTELKKI